MHQKIQDLETAQDLVQDVMIQVYFNKNNIDIHTTFKGYLHTAVRNRFFNYKRDLMRRTLPKISTSSLNTSTNNIVDYINFKERDHALHNAMERLPQQCQKVFQLSREEGLRNHEIADHLSISIKSVESHITRALKFLRKNTIPFLLWLLAASRFFNHRS